MYEKKSKFLSGLYLFKLLIFFTIDVCINFIFENIALKYHSSQIRNFGRFLKFCVQGMDLTPLTLARPWIQAPSGLNLM